MKMYPYLRLIKLFTINNNNLPLIKKVIVSNHYLPLIKIFTINKNASG